MRHPHQERGYSMALWALILALVGLPTLGLALDATRLMQVRGDLQEAADAAAEAAALQVDIPAFRDTGVVQLLPDAPDQAQQVFAQAFATHGGRAGGYISDLAIHETENQVVVTATATWQPFILGLFDNTPTLHAEGWARYRMRTR